VASAASSVSSMPPLPQASSDGGAKSNTDTSPKLPTTRPRYTEAMASVESSISASPWRDASARQASQSAGWPLTLPTIAARVAGVTSASARAASRQPDQ
jgi:hypothetical protein